MDETRVTISFGKKQAEDLSYSLADLACWMEGFRVGLGPDRYADMPMGVEAVRSINIKIKAALSEKNDGASQG